MRVVKTKWVCGPGGLKCGCCRRGSLKEAKRGVRRDERRASKNAVKEAVND